MHASYADSSRPGPSFRWTFIAAPMISEVIRFGFMALALHMVLVAYPTANVTHVPVATHQVKATLVHRHKYSSTARPAIIPAIAPPCVARFVKTPSKNTPSKAPYVIEAICNPTSTTLPARWSASTASPNSTSAHATVVSLAAAYGAPRSPPAAGGNRNPSSCSKKANSGPRSGLTLPPRESPRSAVPICHAACGSQ